MGGGSSLPLRTPHIIGVCNADAAPQQRFMPPWHIGSPVSEINRVIPAPWDDPRHRCGPPRQRTEQTAHDRPDLPEGAPLGLREPERYTRPGRFEEVEDP